MHQACGTAHPRDKAMTDHRPKLKTRRGSERYQDDESSTAKPKPMSSHEGIVEWSRRSECEFPVPLRHSLK
eukprot:14311-Eustigmatos_ZCMA.PRE.1